MPQGILFDIRPRVESIREFEDLTALHLPTVATPVAQAKHWDDSTFSLFLDFAGEKIVRVFNHHSGFRQRMLEQTAPRYLAKWFEHWAEGKFERYAQANEKISPAPSEYEFYETDAEGEWRNDAGDSFSWNLSPVSQQNLNSGVEIETVQEQQPAAELPLTLYQLLVSGVPWSEFSEPDKLKNLRLRSKISIVAVSSDRAKHEQRAAWLSKHLPDHFIEVVPVD